EIVKETLRNFGLQMVLSLGSLLFILWGYAHMDHMFFWNTLAAPFILSVGHFLAPFLLNPLFMNKLFGRPPSQDPGNPAQILGEWTADNRDSKRSPLQTLD